MKTTFSNQEYENAVCDEFGVAYSSDGKKLLRAPSEIGPTYTVRSGVEVICDSAFSDADQLEHIVLPQSLKAIGISAFFRCPSLKEINIPSMETEVEYGSFLKTCKVIRAGEVLDVEEATLP